MNNLAPELLHMVCGHLQYWDVPAFRLINRDCASVGLEYLVPSVEIHLHRNSFKAHSFSRLRDISSHPVMSKNVRKLYYDFHAVDSPMKDFASWKAGAIGALKDPNASRLNSQMFENIPVRTRREFELCYSWYQIIMREQAYYLDENMDFHVLRHAIPNLTNLKKIIINTYDQLYRSDLYDRIGPWHYTLGEFPHNEIKPPGVRQLDSLLLAVASSKIKLRKLRAGLLSWSWFCSPLFVSQRDQITRACESLTSLHLVMSCLGDQHHGEQAPECYQFLSKSGAIRSFLAKLRHLESLKLKFDRTNIWGGRRFPARLSHLIEDGFVWPKLKKLELGGFQTSEPRLFRLLEAHASTLRVFGLQVEVQLDAGGSWYSLLHGMKSMLKLEETRIHGTLETRPSVNNFGEHWHVSDRQYEYRLGNIWAGELEDYLVRGGPFPLTDDNMTPIRFR
jgi:hypothetical protein